MKQRIENHIKTINQAIAWVRANRTPEEYNNKFLSLVGERSHLRTLQQACATNPAIAAYGESQVGKSYMMNCLLQKDGKPFMVKSVEQGQEREYDFIQRMNPFTNDAEATGVVTRFSSFSREPDLYCPEHPILMKCLSLKDVILILSDTYFNDVSDYEAPKEDEVKGKMTEWKARYAQLPPRQVPILSADDMLDMRDYFSRHIHPAQVFGHVGFFDCLALLIEQVPDENYEDIFAILWHNHPSLTRLFRKMQGTLAKLHNASHVYLNAQALLHEGKDNANTIVSVECLKQLLAEEPKFFTDAFLRDGKDFTPVPHLTKSEVCAVCAEVVVKIDEEYLEQTNSYCFDGMKDDDHRLTHDPVTMDILRHNDLLDFPGARSREENAQNTLEGDTLTGVLLRGKVAYLFNSYNENRLINILLYCHHHKQSEVAKLHLSIRDWVKTYVGRTASERARTLQRTGGISPLFYIATKFNIDMAQDPTPAKNETDALRSRWTQRFKTVLYDYILKVDGSLDDEGLPIFLNWTTPGERFQNSYLLRDFVYSGPKSSRLYEGEKGADAHMIMPADLYSNLRSTFCQSEHVRGFFNDPAKAWDVAATVNNDGSLYIIENLSKVAATMEQTRDEKFAEQIRCAAKTVYRLIRDYHYDNDPEKTLQNNIRKAMAIFREMDITENGDNYFFGHLLQALQLTEANCYDIIHKTIEEPGGINAQVNDYKNYELILRTCELHGHPLKNAKKEEERWQCLVDTYQFADKREAQQYLADKKVDCNKLFTFDHERKLNSFIIADAVFDAWAKGIQSTEFSAAHTAKGGFDRGVMSDLVEHITGTAERVKLRDRMAEAIGPIVNVMNIKDANVSLLADMLASLVNDYVLDFGFSALESEVQEEAIRQAESAGMKAFDFINTPTPQFNTDILTEQFKQMTTKAQMLAPSFADHYYRWIGYMQIAFLANTSLPKGFNAKANNELKGILDQLAPETSASEEG